MNNLLLKIRTFALFIIGFGLGYIAFSFPFANIMGDIILLFISIFVLFKALGNIDELNGYGQHHQDSDENHYRDD